MPEESRCERGWAMEWLKRSGKLFWDSLGNIALLVGWIGVSTLTGYAAKASGILMQYAPFSWVAIGIGGGLFAGIAYLVWAMARNVMLVLRMRREQVRRADTIDPMDSIFQNKRIYITDLVNPYDQVVANKKFISCELIGPANIIPLVGAGKFTGNNLNYCDSVEIREGADPNNAILLFNCDFENCKFFKTTFLFQEKFREQADKIITNMNWLTAIEEPVLALEDKPNAETGIGARFRRLIRGDD